MLEEDECNSEQNRAGQRVGSLRGKVKNDLPIAFGALRAGLTEKRTSKRNPRGRESWGCGLLEEKPFWQRRHPIQRPQDATVGEHQEDRCGQSRKRGGGERRWHRRENGWRERTSETFTVTEIHGHS